MEIQNVRSAHRSARALLALALLCRVHHLLLPPTSHNYTYGLDAHLSTVAREQTKDHRRATET